MQDFTKLPKLAKKHLSWYFTWDNIQALTDFNRICGTVPLSLNWATEQQIKDVLSLGTPEICIIYQAYQKSVGTLATDWDGPFQQDLGTLLATCAKMAPVDELVKWIVIDMENWHCTDTYTSAAIFAKCIVLLDILKQAFPNALFVWYGKDEISINEVDPSGWMANMLYPSGVPGWGMCSCYYNEHSVNREVFNRSYNNNKQMIPSISLSMGYSRLRNGSWSKYTNPGPSNVQLQLTGVEINHPWYAKFPLRYPLSQCSVPFLEFDAGWETPFATYVSGAQGV